METFFKYLEQYIDLTESEAAIIVSKLRQTNYLRGQYILQAGNVCKYHNYIVSGNVRAFYLDPNGNEHVVMFGIENWWVSDLKSFDEQSPADFNIQCLEKTKVIQIGYEEMQVLSKEVPKMNKLFLMLMQKAYGNLQRRVVRNYALTARERYLLFCKEYPQIVQRVPQYMIASYIGITKEFLSNIRRQLSK